MKKKIIKPWGYEILLEKNNKYMFKKLFMKKGHQCSLQFHKKKKKNNFCFKWNIKDIFWEKKSIKIQVI